MYHASKSKYRPKDEPGSDSPSANRPIKTPMTIEATAAHVETTTALPSLRPLVCPITHTSLSIHKIPSRRCPHVRTPATTKKMEKLLTIHINVWLGRKLSNQQD
jgi:hypothetical protein